MESYLMKEPTPDTPPGDRWLAMWRGAQAGDQEAEARLLGEVRPFLKGLVQKQLQDQAFGAWDASDVVQECCVKMLLPGTELRDTTGGEFLAWLQTMARNEFLDALRSGKARKRGGDRLTVQLPGDSSGGETVAAPMSTPSQQLNREEEKERLEAGLSGLAPDDQQVIRLRFLDHREWPEVAQLMGRAEAAVKRLYYRALERLKKGMGGKP
jgi:RNA polymerase sigma-70 factor (subfamily 1)